MPPELVPSHISEDLVEALEVMLQGARTGYITGIAFAAILKGNRRYMTDWAGTVHRSPTFALGMVQILSGELEELVHQHDPEDTR